jgi:hypothetical protein
MFSSKLVNHWFYNLINHKVNDEILLLVLPSDKYHREKLKNSFSNLQTKNYELIEIESITSINKIENNKNTIILGQPRMNIDLLNNLQNCVLHSSWEGSYQFFLSDKHIEDIKRCSVKKPITGITRYTYFYEPRNPISLLHPLNVDLLEYTILELSMYTPQTRPFDFIRQIFSSSYIYKEKDKRYSCDWENLIIQDIFYLSKSHILTARLAMLIYKISIFKLDDSNTKIGNFYRIKLGLKSKTVRLPQDIYRMPGHTTKAYDLTDYWYRLV